jgi:hypothetical protein
MTLQVQFSVRMDGVLNWSWFEDIEALWFAWFFSVMTLAHMFFTHQQQQQQQQSL